MKTVIRSAAAALLVSLALMPAQVPTAVAAQPAASGAACPAWLNHEFRKLHSSQKVNLCQAYAGKPMIIVNTASHCGFTPQFKGLEAVHQKYKDRGLVVVGFSSNDFNQESADEAKAADTCFVNYGVTFMMITTQKVKGDGANPVFVELARQSKAPSWNFNKYLVRADGKVLQHLDSRVAPDSQQFTDAVEQLLN